MASRRMMGVLKEGRAESHWMTKKKTGVRNRPKTVTPSMPLKTAVPNARRISAPAPLATTKGTTPKMKASEVIKMGRSRILQASTTASCGGLPSSVSCLANSTMRMAFLLASPTSTTKPICVKILISMRAIATPTTLESRHMGTTKITASGSAQFSYRAASTKKTNTTAMGKTILLRQSVASSRCSRFSSVHSVVMAEGMVLLAMESRVSIASVELRIHGRAMPLMGAARYRL